MRYGCEFLIEKWLWISSAEYVPTDLKYINRNEHKVYLLIDDKIRLVFDDLQHGLKYSTDTFLYFLDYHIRNYISTLHDLNSFVYSKRLITSLNEYIFQINKLVVNLTKFY